MAPVSVRRWLGYVANRTALTYPPPWCWIRAGQGGARSPQLRYRMELDGGAELAAAVCPAVQVEGRRQGASQSSVSRCTACVDPPHVCRYPHVAGSVEQPSRAPAERTRHLCTLGCKGIGAVCTPSWRVGRRLPTGEPTTPTAPVRERWGRTKPTAESADDTRSPTATRSPIRGWR